MALLYGTDTLEERMKKDGMSNPTFVSCNQKYSAYDNPRHVDKEDRQDKKKDDSRKYHAEGGPIDMDQDDEDDDRSAHAMGGVAKLRRGEYYGSMKKND